MSRDTKFEFPKEIRSHYVNGIISFFQNERDEVIGIIAAEQVLDFFLNEIGDEIYKKALRDAKKIVKEKLEGLEVELDILTG